MSAGRTADLGAKQRKLSTRMRQSRSQFSVSQPAPALAHSEERMMRPPHYVPAGLAPYYNFLWRYLTLYLAAIAGLLCLLRALAQDAQQVIRRVGLLEERPPPASDYETFVPASAIGTGSVAKLKG